MPRRSRRMPPIAASLLATLVMPAVVLGAAPDEPTREEVERLYVEGQDRYTNGEFVSAADTWMELLGKWPESPDNRVARSSVMFNVIQARIDAYQRLRTEDGSKDIEHLHAAKQAVDAYLAEHRAAYGEEQPIESNLQAKISELDEEIEAAQREAEDGVHPCLQPCLQPCLSPPPCLEPWPPPKIRSGCGRDDSTGQAVGLLPLIVLARRRRRDALARLASRLPPDVVERLDARLRDDDEPEES